MNSILMSLYRYVLFGLVLLLIAGCGSKTATIGFNDSIQPILSEYCYHCHGSDGSSRKAQLRLDNRESATAKRGERPAAIVPGDAAASLLVQRIEHADIGERMPPPEAHKELNAAQIELLRRWIDEGAAYEPHWAFVTPKRPAVPELRSAGLAHPVDQFILEQLEKQQLKPAKTAIPQQLIRRVTLDLTGLLPTPEETAAFVADSSAQAYEKLVDRLLASPAFGEHRARYWLDYVRYGDTHGIHFDNYRTIWPYRDWVVNAFNQNISFDRFVTLQLAGDLLPVRSLDELLPTGYLRQSLTTFEGGAIPEELRVNVARDRMENFGAVFLGMTTGCAVCHDHKFDPTTQKDVYQLAAFLNNTTDAPWDFNAPDPSPALQIPPAERVAEFNALLAEKSSIQEKIRRRERQAPSQFAAWQARGGRPLAVSDGLLVRMPLDEGQGDTVKIHTPRGKEVVKTTGSPLVWQEQTLFWPAARLDQATQLALPQAGNFAANQAFSFSAWVFMPSRGTVTIDSGSLVSRMSSVCDDAQRAAFEAQDAAADESAQPSPDQFMRRCMGRGWEIYAEHLDDRGESEFQGVERQQTRLVVNLVGSPQQFISVAAEVSIYEFEWSHLALTYDGSGLAQGMQLAISGQPVVLKVLRDTLRAGDKIADIRTTAPLFLGRRAGGEPYQQITFQDVRLYDRVLAGAELARLPWEDPLARLLVKKPEPEMWNTDERYLVQQFYLNTVDRDARNLYLALQAQDAKFAAVTSVKPLPADLDLGQAPVEERLQWYIDNRHASLIAQEKSTPAYAYVLNRGQYASRKERVGPEVPHFLPPMAKDLPRNRLGLARWLASAEHPLFARVAVNRMWQELFGRGLVETANDFGVAGSRPSHPQLLDWLAVEFREKGWDVKQLYRLLVLSATYQQSNTVTPELLEKDPANLWLARGPRTRLDGEVIRDTALQVAGLLSVRRGGAPVKPYAPEGLWEEVAMPESNTLHYQQDDGEALYRRSMYTFWKRGSAPASFETFDAPSRETTCTRRNISNTPLQAFVTLNDPQFVEAARVLAQRVLTGAREGPAPVVSPAALDRARLEQLSTLTLARVPTVVEQRELTELLRRHRGHFTQHPSEAAQLLEVGEYPILDTQPKTELASWTLLASHFFNLDESLTK